MSINKYKPHIFILPEDDANRQIANGFLLNPRLDRRAIEVLPIVGGWLKVLSNFETDHISSMREYPNRRMILLIDMDQKNDRRYESLDKIPSDLKDRVFILGVSSEPEKLKVDTRKSYETIGKILSEDCVNNTRDLWSHSLLEHNRDELERIISSIESFLFQ
jgi:hypothetical protein